jgi:hypothetical protein
VRGRVRHLRVELAVSAGLIGLALVVGWLVGGGPAALGAAAGVGLVTASYVASTMAIAWADSVAPRLVFPVGMVMYVTKFSLFGSLLVVLGGSGWAGLIPMAMGIVAGVVAWTGTQIWWTVRHEHPYVQAVPEPDQHPR